MDLVQLYLLVLGLLFLGNIIYRSVRFRQQFKLNPLSFMQSPSHTEKLTWILLMLLLLVYTSFLILVSLGYTFLPFGSFSMSALYVGALLGVLGFVFMAVAQKQMGENWRMGVDSQGNISLMDSGIFSVSRNPVYVGVLLIAFAVFLLIQDFVSLLFFLSVVLLLMKVISIEEPFLQEKFGKAYEKYRERVPRFV